MLNAAGGHVRSIVIRPGCVYGGSGSLTASWFQSATTEGAARIVGDGNFRWTMAHVSDVAEAYCRAAESPWQKEVFHISDRSRFTVLECARSVSRSVTGADEVRTTPVEEAEKHIGPIAQCLVLDQHIDASKASRMLGWQPRHGGFVDGVETWCQAWRASAHS